jgi:hypothetical protein
MCQINLPAYNEQRIEGRGTSEVAAGLAADSTARQWAVLPSHGCGTSRLRVAAAARCPLLLMPHLDTLLSQHLNPLTAAFVLVLNFGCFSRA